QFLTKIELKHLYFLNYSSHQKVFDILKSFEGTGMECSYIYEARSGKKLKATFCILVTAPTASEDYGTLCCSQISVIDFVLYCLPSLRNDLSTREYSLQEVLDQLERILCGKKCLRVIVFPKLYSIGE
ncbi:hypothetical protein L9F63_004540, partial [Diploptera punctata]